MHASIYIMFLDVDRSWEGTEEERIMKFGKLPEDILVWRWAVDSLSTDPMNARWNILGYRAGREDVQVYEQRANDILDGHFQRAAVQGSGGEDMRDMAEESVGRVKTVTE